MDPKNKDFKEKETKPNTQEFPGYPQYPDNEDIYVKSKDLTSINPDDLDKIDISIVVQAANQPVAPGKEYPRYESSPAPVLTAAPSSAQAQEMPVQFPLWKDHLMYAVSAQPALLTAAKDGSR